MELPLHRDSIQRRPGKLSSEAHLYRVQINSTSPGKFAFHPDENSAKSFNICPEMLTVRKTNIEINFVRVDTLLKLKDMIKVLEKQSEIAIDIEGDHRFNYVPITCLIQISCEGYDFVIDSIALYHYIYEYLKDIFLSKSIVKLFWGSADFSHLKRDFNLYLNAVIDVQNVYQKYNKFANPSKFSSFVTDLIDINVVGKEKYQTYSWRMRPLPEEAILYARNDSRYLFDAWQMLKIKCADFLMSEYNLKSTIDLIVKQARLPTPREPVNDFLSCSNDPKIELKSFLKVSDHQAIFVELFKWTDKTARLRDSPIFKVLSLNDLCSLSVVKPQSQCALFELLPRLRSWKSISVESLIDVIVKNCNVKKVASTPFANNSKRNVKYCNSDESSDDEMIVVNTKCVNYDDDWDDIVVEIQNDTVKCSDDNDVPVEANNNSTIENVIVHVQENESENVINLNTNEIEMVTNCDEILCNNDNTADSEISCDEINVGIRKGTKTMYNKYDCIDSFEKVRLITDDEILNNFLQIRRSKMLKSWIGYIRNKRRKIRQKICNSERVKLNLKPISFRYNKNKDL